MVTPYPNFKLVALRTCELSPVVRLVEINDKSRWWSLGARHGDENVSLSDV